MSEILPPVRDPWWVHPEVKWWVMLAVFLVLGIFFLLWGERDASRVAFGMVVGQAASGGWTATKLKPAA